MVQEFLNICERLGQSDLYFIHAVCRTANGTALKQGADLIQKFNTHAIRGVEELKDVFEIQKHKNYFIVMDCRKGTINVPENYIALAIGKGGQNIKNASKQSGKFLKVVKCEANHEYENKF